MLEPVTARSYVLERCLGAPLELGQAPQRHEQRLTVGGLLKAGQQRLEPGRRRTGVPVTTLPDDRQQLSR
jgi:hypothetical protein